jgi:signal transduction histidine kinase
MVQNLIEVYRFENGKPTLTLELVALDQIASPTVNELAVLAADKGIQLIQNIPENLGGIAVDRQSIRRVLQNLLDNAIKFSDRGGAVQIIAEEEVHAITIHVKDTGIGIPADEQGSIFERFVQGKRRTVGSGLGLYLCKQIVTAHKGTITCSSIEGRGTTFSVRLPRNTHYAPLETAAADTTASGDLAQNSRSEHELRAIGNAGRR